MTFNLGDKFAPKVQTSVSNVLNPQSANISNDDPLDFSKAGPDKLQLELLERLNKSGQFTNFENPYVGTTNEMFVENTPTYSPNELPQGTRPSTMDMKVTIRQEPAVEGGINELVFKVMPRISENGGAEYESIMPLQHPGGIQKYRGSTPRTWNITGRLIARTSEEASENLAICNMIRAWRMPFYGEGTAQNGNTSALLGAPPPILTMTAYGPNMIGPVKCVLNTYSWEYDNQIDYIPTLDGQAWPVILDVSLNMTESYSPSEFSGFDLAKFKMGDLSNDGAFRRVVTSTPITQVPNSISPNEPTNV